MQCPDSEKRIRELEDIVIRLDYRQTTTEKDTIEIKEVLKDMRNLLVEVVRLQAKAQEQDSRIENLREQSAARKIETDTVIQKGNEYMAYSRMGAKIALIVFAAIQSLVGYYISQNTVFHEKAQREIQSIETRMQVMEDRIGK